MERKTLTMHRSTMKRAALLMLPLLVPLSAHAQRGGFQGGPGGGWHGGGPGRFAGGGPAGFRGGGWGGGG
ncbi:hypothetical protein, partial [Asaia astilbis]|uniref:hypothetical protein n=1 Tax=Asaia astilbis TaxID=610244 RepID=UPI00056434BA